MTITVSTQAPQVVQARSAAYTLIAYALQYPDRELIETLANPEQWTDWPDVLKAADGAIYTPLQAVRDALLAEAEMLANCSDEQPCDLQCRHDILFGHAVRGKCPAYEMEYGRHEIIRQASDLADIAGFYGAFGLQFTDGADGRPDHISAECEFMSALCAKEAYALTRDDEEKVDVCVNAERAFLKDHLARWLPAFARRIEKADPTGLYGEIARFAEAFVKAECDNFDIHAGPQKLELRPTDPVLDRSISCGPADCGAQRSSEQFVQLKVDPGRELEG